MIRCDKRRRQVRDAKPLLRAAMLGSAKTETSWRPANVIDDTRREQRPELRIAAAIAGDLCCDSVRGRAGQTATEP